MAGLTALASLIPCIFRETPRGPRVLRFYTEKISVLMLLTNLEDPCSGPSAGMVCPGSQVIVVRFFQSISGAFRGYPRRGELTNTPRPLKPPAVQPTHVPYPKRRISVVNASHSTYHLSVYKWRSLRSTAPFAPCSRQAANMSGST
jgi:hypothetical protein